MEGDDKSMKMHCVYNSMAKGISKAEMTLNSKKIKQVALAIVKLRHQSDSQSFIRKFH